MSTLTRTRRMPTEYRVRASGVTEIQYSATPEVIPVLPGTRWLEQRRERETRLAAARMIEAAASPAAPKTVISAPVIDTALNEFNFTANAFSHDPIFAQPEQPHGDASLSWTERMRMATTRLVKRQAPWLLSLYGQDATFDLSHQA